jgi:hypothetical protein
MSSSDPSSPRSGAGADTECDGVESHCESEEERCEFDISIELADHSDDKNLTPLRIPDYSESGSTQTDNQAYVNFEIEVEDNTLDFLEIEIFVGVTPNRRRVYYEELGYNYRTVGTHEWRWDGYSEAGILDTRVLKDPSLELELRGMLCGVRKDDIIRFDNEPAEQDWVDVRIDRGALTVEVELRIDLRDGGENGVGELPPSEIFTSGATPDYSGIPAGDARRQAHARARSFNDLKNLVRNGFSSYWSRNSSNGLTISTPFGSHTVTTTPVITTEHSMDDVNLEYNTNGDWGRSSNPGSIRGFFSFIANIFVPERSIYNAGWIRYEASGNDSGWRYQNLTDEDDAFKETSAHEIGHEILSAYGGEDYSYGHRGSSSVITQTTLELTDGGVSYPASGEIDLMKYYNGTRPADFYHRVVACEIDVKSLLWLARVEFDD